MTEAKCNKTVGDSAEIWMGGFLRKFKHLTTP